MRRLAEAGHDVARGVRQLRPQHHGVRLRRRVGRPSRSTSRRTPRSMTRYFLRHPLASSLPRKFKIALRGLRRGSREGDDQRHRLARPRSQNGRRGFRVLVGGGTATMPVSGMRAVRLPAGRGHAQRRRGDRSGVPRARRLQAQAQEPHEVPDQVARLGRSGARSSSARWRTCAPRAACALPFDPASPPEEQAPDWRAADPPSVAGRRGARRRPATCADPASVPIRQPVLAGRTTRLRALGDDERPPPEAGGLRRRDRDRSARRPVEQQMRVLADLSLAYGDGTVRVTPTQNLVFRWVPQRRGAGALRAAGRGRPAARRRRHDRRRHQLPGRRVVQARGDAVARPRAVPRRSTCARTRARSTWRRRSTSRSAAARTAAASTTSPPSGSRAACARSMARPAPQYFVMVGGGVTVDGATFGRLAAKIPARRGGRRRSSGSPSVLCRRAAARTRRPRRSSTASTSPRSRSCWPISSR